MSEIEFVQSATTVIKSCLLPTLHVDIGDPSLAIDQFKDFKSNVNDSLKLLFELIECKKTILLAKSDDSKVNDFQTHLILLICEQQSIENELSRIDAIELQKYLTSLLCKYGHVICNSNNVDDLFEVYQKQLNKTCWKRNVGALYGFIEFSQLVLEQNQDSYVRNKCSEKLMFFLITGLMIIDFYDPNVQLLGLKLFSCLLKQEWLKRQLVDQNIHSVIYENIFRLTTKTSELKFLKNLWTCLYRCAECDVSLKQMPHSQWSRFDDVFEQLLERIAMESNAMTSIFYLQQIHMFSLLYKRDNNQPNYSIYRWVKRLQKILINETSKFAADVIVLQTQLHNLHSVYLATIATIPAGILGKSYNVFIENFVSNLLDALNLNMTEECVIKEVREFLISLNDHCESGETRKNLEILLSQKVFL